MTWGIANISTEDRNGPKSFSSFEVFYLLPLVIASDYLSFLLIECRENRQKLFQ